MPPNARRGSRRFRPTGRVVGALVLAGLVGFRELRHGRASKPTNTRRTRLGFYRPRHRRRRRGGRIALACFALSTAGVVTLPLVWFNTRPASDVGVLTGIRAARAATPPTTAVPLAPDRAPVGTYPARLQEQPARVVNRPVAVHIRSLGLDAPTVPVGVVPDSTLLEAPADAATLGWYEHGPAPGEAGSSVIAGHVDRDGRRGAFFGLSGLDPDATVTVDYQDGSTRDWRVVARRQYRKSELPIDLLFARTGAPTLALVTCGGLYDASSRYYQDNVVVFAVPVTS